MALYENYSIKKAWFDAIKDRVDYKNLVEETDGYYSADFEYFGFHRVSVKEGYMKHYKLPAMDLIREYNESIGINFASLLEKLTYKENDISLTIEQIVQEIEGIEWVIGSLEKYKDNLDDILYSLEEEKSLGD